MFMNFKKSLGQNFLIDQNIIEKIIKIGKIEKNKTILEIGSGNGSLTRKITSTNAKKIIAVEKDNKLASLLKNNFNNFKNVKIINDDIFNVIKNNNLEQNTIVFGNLPYNISTQILASLTLLEKWPPWYEVMILMFQKEVANRILAKKNTKDFGRLSILCNWRLDIKKHFDVSKNCFFPKPKVNSTVLSFRPKKNINFNIKNPKNLEMITRVLFTNRRKMINKNFTKLFMNNKLVAKDLNLDLSQRPGELSNEMFYKIVMRYEKLFD
ncbi:MAG: ribosomal RNA small subunit methyltransferase A [Candidatus Pelagibacter sp.]|nr:ribosomal RNA small subunit methyltransferase A [Candidatus Pelagibacter sp.]